MDFDHEMCKKSATRIKSLRKKNRLTQDELAKSIDRSVAMVRHYEKGEYPVPDEVAKSLYRRFGSIPEYWMGLTDAQTRAAFLAEVEAAEYAVIKEHSAEIEEENTRRRNFFNMCGYQYRDLAESHDPVYWAHVWGVALENSEKYQHPVPEYQIIDTNEPETAMYLGEHDFQELLDKIHDLIAFECWKKQRKQEQSIEQDD